VNKNFSAIGTASLGGASIAADSHDSTIGGLGQLVEQGEALGRDSIHRQLKVDLGYVAAAHRAISPLPIGAHNAVQTEVTHHGLAVGGLFVRNILFGARTGAKGD
jgi:hypothetical protein